MGHVAVPEHIRALLVCPSCRGELTDEPGALICEGERLKYAVVDGVPHLVKELAKRYRGPSKARA